MKLTEDRAKGWLAQHGIKVPEGAAAVSAEDVTRIARELAGPVVVKALVPAGRRGKSGGVRDAGNPDEAGAVAREILGREVHGYRVERLYVERRLNIQREFYWAVTFGPTGIKIVASTAGGIEIEGMYAKHPDGMILQDVDPIRGLRAWDGIALWERAGGESRLLPMLADMSVNLFEAFRDADATMLEVNPIVIDEKGVPVVAGAMLEIDDNALFRHPVWAADEIDGRELNVREQQVVEANRAFPGGAIRYIELDGDIGLLVAGGGAGLLQHDLILAAGGRPANHTDVSPGPSPEKIAVVLSAIFRNPRAKSLLVGFNHLQMAPCDLIVEALLIAIKREQVDPQMFPIVVRLFGPREEEARKLAQSIPGIRYLAHGTSLADAVRAVVELAAQARRGG